MSAVSPVLQPPAAALGIRWTNACGGYLASAIVNISSRSSALEYEVNVLILGLSE